MTVRILITGADGFVAPYVGKALHRLYGTNADIIPTSLHASQHAWFGTIAALDVADRAAVRTCLAEVRPTHIVHLAGIATVQQSSADPEMAWTVNVRGARNVAQAILDHAPDCWMLNVGSGLIYGETAASSAALDEQSLVAPVDDYGVTKAAADLALGVLARRGLKVIRLRPFNHTGAGQTDDFAVPAFAKQIARIEAGQMPATIRVGNLDAKRDFLDVRDVARAYALATRQNDRIVPGTILNIASGRAHKIGDLLQQLLDRSRTRITIEIDPNRLRPSDIPCVIGNPARASDILGWAPEFTIDQTLDAVLADQRARLSS